ncbi:hypothetical protein Tco_0077981 [Tanacetum coccineum]
METHKPLLKDADGEDVDEHLYRSMIGSLMYLTYSRPNIMFAVCACARFQINPKSSHLHAVKRIFRYLKGASLDRKSTIGGCQFLGCRLILWQCKKQTVVANSTTKAEYIAASNCYGQLKVNAVKHNLLLLSYYCWVTYYFQLKVNAARHKLRTAGELAFLEKPTESAGFEEIVDFLNAHTIKEVQLQALVDKKKVIITESTIRRDLHLEDAEGTECLPTATIFKELTRMRYDKLTQKLTFYKAFFSPQWKFLIHTILNCLSAKTTAWNEFSSTMASAIICLATNQKFNFSKYIFDNMVKNLEGGVKFLMYPRFIQLFVNQQLGDMSHHKRIYVNSSHTKKVFRNMKREEKGFSRRVTPLFPTMMVQAHEEMGEDETANVESVPTHSNYPLLSGEDSIKLNKLMEICSKLQQRVLDLENTKTAQAHDISSLKLRVKRLEKKGGSRTHKLKRLFKIGRSAQVISSYDKGLGAQEDASKQGRKIADIDADAEVTLVDKIQGRNDEEMFDTGILDGEEVFAEQDVVEKEISVVDLVTTTGEIVTTTSVEVTIDSATTTTINELTLAQTLIEIKAAKPKVKGVIIEEPSESTTTTTTITTPAASKPSQNKGKARMTEPEKPLKKKDHIMYDKEVSLNLQAQLQVELEEEEMLER